MQKLNTVLLTIIACLFFLASSAQRDTIYSNYNGTQTWYNDYVCVGETAWFGGTNINPPLVRYAPFDSTITTIGNPPYNTPVYTYLHAGWKDSGLVEANILPTAAEYGGARWKVDFGNWMNSGIIVELVPGTYTITFEQLYPYTTPPQQTVTVGPTCNVVTTVAGNYGTVGINEIADTRTVLKVSYYNLIGQPVDKCQPCVEQLIYSDGTMENRKVFINK